MTENQSVSNLVITESWQCFWESCPSIINIVQPTSGVDLTTITTIVTLITIQWISVKQIHREDVLHSTLHTRLAASFYWRSTFCATVTKYYKRLGYRHLQTSSILERYKISRGLLECQQARWLVGHWPSSICLHCRALILTSLGHFMSTKHFRFLDLLVC